MCGTREFVREMLSSSFFGKLSLFPHSHHLISFSSLLSFYSLIELYPLVDNYQVMIVFMISIAGFVQGYTEMMSILLIHDANFLEYITTSPEYFTSSFVFLLYFGSILGALMSSSLSDWLGR